MALDSDFLGFPFRSMSYETFLMAVGRLWMLGTRTPLPPQLSVCGFFRVPDDAPAQGMRQGFGDEHINHLTDELSSVGARIEIHDPVAFRSTHQFGCILA